jgi:hypothetical protein
MSAPYRRPEQGEIDGQGRDNEIGEVPSPSRWSGPPEGALGARTNKHKARGRVDISAHTLLSLLDTMLTFSQVRTSFLDRYLGAGARRAKQRRRPGACWSAEGSGSHAGCFANRTQAARFLGRRALGLGFSDPDPF